MAVKYKKLFHLLIEKDVSTSQFQKICGFPGNRLGIYKSDPRSVLPPVVLFFQEQDQFVEGAFCVKLWRPPAEERHSAFVFDLF